jgi:hypothetical protein
VVSEPRIQNVVTSNINQNSCRKKASTSSHISSQFFTRQETRGRYSSKLLLVATIATGFVIALKVDALCHLGGGFTNFKLQGMKVFRGVSTALDLGHVDLRIVGLDSHQCIGRSCQAGCPQQGQQPVRNIY